MANPDSENAPVMTVTQPATAPRVLLVEDLRKQCFVGYEDATADELREMVRRFSEKSPQVSNQQRRAFEELTNTAKTVGLARERLQKMHKAQAEAELRADTLDSELAAAQAALNKAQEDSQSTIQELQQRLETDAKLIAEREAALHKEQEDSQSRIAELQQRLEAQAKLDAERQTLPPPAVATVCTDEFVVTRCSGTRNSRYGLSCDAAVADQPQQFRTLEDMGMTVIDDEITFVGPGASTLPLSSGAMRNSRYGDCLNGPIGDQPQRSTQIFRIHSVDDADVTIVDDQLSPLSPHLPPLQSSQSEAVGKSTASGLRYLLQRRQPGAGDQTPAFASEDCVTLASGATSSEDHRPAKHSEEERAEEVKQNVKRSHQGIFISGKLLDQLYEQCVVRGKAGLRGRDTLLRVLESVIDGDVEQCKPGLGSIEEDCAEVLTQVFHSCDTAASGRVEMQVLLEACCATPSVAELLQCGAQSDCCLDQLLHRCKDMNLDGSSEVTVEQFVAFCKGLTKSSHLHDESDAGVSRQEFEQIVQELLSARRAREVHRYEAGDAASCGLSAGDVAPASASAPSLQATGSSVGAGQRLVGSMKSNLPWASLPSWSMELSRLSTDPGSSAALGEEQQDGGAQLGKAADHWRAVTSSLDQLCESSNGHVADGISVSLLHELRGELSLFVRSYAEEARARLRGVRASTARLLEQRRETIDELTGRLETRDTELQQALDDWNHIRVERDQLHIDCERLRSAAEPAESVASLESLVSSLRSELATANAVRQTAERQLADMNLAVAPVQKQGSLRSIGFAEAESAHALSPGGEPTSSSSSTAKVPDSALQRAVDAERKLRQELLDIRDELQRRAEVDQQAQAEKATDAAVIQDRLSEMHGGGWFEKVAFRTKKRQQRFLRLSFDLRRIEWGASERGAAKALPVEAILRVDFGDASRAFQAYEFNGDGRPPAHLCFSITTPSRTLDLVALSERDVEAWVLGLNEVVPYRPERQRLTTQDFLLRRAILRLEGSSSAPSADLETASGGSGTTGTTSNRSAMSALRSMLPSGYGRAAPAVGRAGRI